jgi:hypothetical protein
VTRPLVGEHDVDRTFAQRLVGEVEAVDSCVARFGYQGNLPAARPTGQTAPSRTGTIGKTSIIGRNDTSPVP